MARISLIESNKKLNFLDSAVGIVTKTCTVPDTGVVADEKGNKIVVAGTPFPANDATATGILFEDVDVTDGEHEGALLVAGRVYADRLAVALDTAAKTALETVGIKFVDAVGAERD